MYSSNTWCRMRFSTPQALILTTRTNRMVSQKIVNKQGYSPDSLLQLIRWLFKSLYIHIKLPMIFYKVIKVFQTTKIDLRDKVVMITGSSSGIGRAMAYEFYSHGCKLILTARRAEELHRVKDELLYTKQIVPTHVPIVLPFDITQMDGIETKIDEAIEQCGHIDVLVNNAGIGYRGLIVDTSIEVYKKVMEANFFGQVAITKAILKHMLERKSGHIVFMSSLQAKLSLPCRSAYGASKHAIQAFADALRAEVGKNGIRVSSICPSYVKTELSRNAMTGNGDIYNKTDKDTKKGDSPENIAKLVYNTVTDNVVEVWCGPLLHRIFAHSRTLLPYLHFKVLGLVEKGMYNEYVKTKK